MSDSDSTLIISSKFEFNKIKKDSIYRISNKLTHKNEISEFGPNFLKN